MYLHWRKVLYFSFFCMHSQLDTGCFTYYSLVIFPNFQAKAFWTSTISVAWLGYEMLMFNCAIKCKASTALWVYNVFLCNSHWEAQRFTVHHSTLNLDLIVLLGDWQLLKKRKWHILEAQFNEYNWARPMKTPLQMRHKSRFRQLKVFLSLPH